MNIKPLGDRVLVEPLKEAEVNKGGIIIPDTAKEKSQEGVVIAVGDGELNQYTGELIPIRVKKGDVVLMPKYGGNEIKKDGKEYQLVASRDILAVIG
jgi:chaperonin GroES